ncbi:hypothetical protein GUJ93_ZPchr0010g7939 [Zizania palustris]|uniref:Uncharacterized protein n=1 Tax=Zizania palustris TaxID=103762 RepID=A0A8J5WBD2_ZIZPA|nr:hypothetical protein GUJ93_ZPchr0010g7939 [Zizania palustris]
MGDAEAEAVAIPVEEELDRAAEKMATDISKKQTGPTVTTMDCAEAEVVAIQAEDAETVALRLKVAAEKAEAYVSKKETKIHRFPESMRSFGYDGGYVVPNTVAIGPYHRHRLHLRQAEEKKRAAAHYFCRDSDRPAKAVYERVLSVAGEARSCYDDDATDGISEAEFAAMMFHDGCFLVQFMLSCTGEEVAPPLESWFNTTHKIGRDVFLLENQIPWLVLHALMELSARPVLVGKFIAIMATAFYRHLNLQNERPIFILDEHGSSITQWPHLLDLLRCCVSGRVSNDESTMSWTPPTCSAIELEQIGIKLTASRTAELKDMGIKRGLLFGKLFLTPFLMDRKGTCWLVNMVALEDCISVTSWDENITVIGSYIAVLAMLMNREEDVHKLRAKGLVKGRFSDQETLQFFKTLVKHINIGPRYTDVLVKIEAYKRDRWLWIALHKFVYNNIKTIVTVFTVVGVLVGIFKTLLDIKQHQK